MFNKLRLLAGLTILSIITLAVYISNPRLDILIFLIFVNNIIIVLYLPLFLSKKKDDSQNRMG